MRPDDQWNIVGDDEISSGAGECVQSLPASLRSDQLFDEHFEANLPDDYALVAEQLTCDARHLAEKYPAAAVKGAAFQKRKQRKWISVAAAVGLLAVGIASVSWSMKSSSLVDRSAPLGIAADDNHLPPTAKIAGRESLHPAGIQEVGVAPMAEPRPAIDEVKMLQIQIDAFEQVIRKLQADLARKEQLQTETDALVKSLRDEIAQLRRQVDERSDEASRDSR